MILLLRGEAQIVDDDVLAGVIVKNGVDGYSVLVEVVFTDTGDQLRSRP